MAPGYDRHYVDDDGHDDALRTPSPTGLPHRRVRIDTATSDASMYSAYGGGSDDGCRKRSRTVVWRLQAPELSATGRQQVRRLSMIPSQGLGGAAAASAAGAAAGSRPGDGDDGSDSDGDTFHDVDAHDARRPGAAERRWSYVAAKVATDEAAASAAQDQEAQGVLSRFGNFLWNATSTAASTTGDALLTGGFVVAGGIGKRVEVLMSAAVETAQAALPTAAHVKGLLVEKAELKAIAMLDVGFDVFIADQRNHMIDSDEHMPGMVRRWVNAAADSIVPQIKYEVMAIAENITKQAVRRAPPINRVHHLTWKADFYKKCRAEFLYAYRPYDVSFWGQLYNPAAWVLLLLKMLPWAGVQSFTFLVIFVLMDTHDEDQLMKFVMELKRMQFFSTGCLSCVYGALQLVRCVSFQRLGSACEDATRSREGWINMVVLMSAAGFVLLMIMVHRCGALMRGAIPKGGTVRRGFRLVGDRIVWKPTAEQDIHKATLTDAALEHELEASDRAAVVSRRLEKAASGINPHAMEQAMDEAEDDDGPATTAPGAPPPRPKVAKGKWMARHHRRYATVVAYCLDDDEHAVVFDDDPEHVEVWLKLFDESQSQFYVLRDESAVNWMRYLLIIDWVWFITCILGFFGTLVWMQVTFNNISASQLQAAVYWAKTMYALGAFPFLFASLPPYNRVLSHARGTGYDRDGHSRSVIRPWMRFQTAQSHKELLLDEIVTRQGRTSSAFNRDEAAVMAGLAADDGGPPRPMV